jgi:hypothetical protein
MLRARSAGTRRSRRRAGPYAWPRHEGLARANRSAIDRLAGHRRRGRFRNSGARAGGRCRHGRARRAQFFGKVGPRRDNGSSHRLACERTALLLGRRALGRLHRSARLLRWLGRALRERRSRHRGRGGARRSARGLGTSRKGLSRAGKNLSRAWWGAGSARYRFRDRRHGTSRRDDSGRRLWGGWALRRGRRGWLGGSRRTRTFRPQTAADRRLNRFTRHRRTDRHGRRRMNFGWSFSGRLRGCFGHNGRMSGGRLRRHGRRCRRGGGRFRFVGALVSLGNGARGTSAIG